MSAGRRDYWQAVALVFSGTAVAQAIPILGSLVIARLFVPAEFGVFMAWLGLASLVGVFATGRFEMTLALEPDGVPRAVAAAATLLTTAGVLFVLALVGAIAWLCFGEGLIQFPVQLVLLFFPATAAFAAAQIWQAWAAAEGRFRALSTMRITQSSAITGLQIAAGLLVPSSSALAVAHVLGVAAGVAVIAVQLPLPRLADKRRVLLSFWSKYRRFPMYSLPADTVNTAAAQLPLTILASRFGTDVAGYVALAFRTLGAPISLLGSAVLDVFKRRASQSWRATGSCRGPFIETFIVLAGGSLAMTCLFWFTGESLFVLAFGEKWLRAGSAAIVLLPLFSLRFVASPLSYTFYIASKQHIDLVWQICLLAMTLATLFSFNAYEHSLLAYALGYGFLYLVYVILSFRFSAGKAE